MRKQTYFEQRPWGSFNKYADNEKVAVKILFVDPGALLSYQRHKKRDKLWIPLDEGLYVVINDNKLNVTPHQEIDIPVGALHRAGCYDNVPRKARILEISFGEFDENDEERVKDVYNRKSPK